MKAEMRHTSYIIDFLDVTYKTDVVDVAIMKIANDSLKRIKQNEKIADWTVEFHIIYGGGTSIAIYTRNPSLKSEKLKEIVIHVPIPLTNDV